MGPITRLFIALSVFLFLDFATAQMQLSCALHTDGTNCDTTDDTVNCDAPSTGELCQTPATCSDPSTDCQNVGVIENGDERCDADNNCICQDGFYGNDCEIEGIVLQCTEESFTVTVNTRPVTGGGETVVYFYDSDTFDLNTNCKFSVNSGSDVAQVFNAQTGTDPCSFTPPRSEGTYELHMYLQLSSLMIGKTDQGYRLRCTPGDGGANTYVATDKLASDQIQAVSQVPTLLSSTKTSEDSITMQLVKVDDAGVETDITTEDVIAVGDRLNLKIATSGDFTVNECEASNNEEYSSDGEGNAKITFIADLCVASPYNVLFADNIDFEEGVYTIALYAWYLPGDSTKLYLRCRVCKDENSCKVSPDASVVCNAFADITEPLVQSNNAFTNRRRRRRQADQGDTTNTTTSLGVSLEISTGRRDLSVYINDQQSGNEDITTDCYKSTSVLLPVILLASLLAVTMVITFFFCFKLVRLHERRDVAGEANMAYK